MHQPLIGKIATAVGLTAGLALDNAQLDSLHPSAPPAANKAFHCARDAERKRKARKAQKAAKKARRRNRGR